MYAGSRCTKLDKAYPLSVGGAVFVVERAIFGCFAPRHFYGTGFTSSAKVPFSGSGRCSRPLRAQCNESSTRGTG